MTNGKYIFRGGVQMNIALFGATGAIGSIFMNIALENGDTVNAYARSPSKIKLKHNNLHIINGELTNESALEAVISKSDIVVCLVGPALKGKRSDMRTPIADGHKAIINTMRKLNKSRLITLATPSIRAAGDENSLLLKIISFGAKLFLPWAYRDMVKLGSVIYNSGIDWTVIRIMSPNSKSSGAVYDVAVGNQKAKMSVSRENIAKFFYEVASRNIYIKQMPIVFNR
jgi:putative NADH-flavin reductase